MRVDGVELTKRLHMARVAPSPQIPFDKWKTGHYRVMPLPGLMGENYSARFNEMGLVESATLQAAERVACLTPYGVNLLQQRFIWFLTRFLAPTHRLGEASDSVFQEAELEEEWMVIATGKGADPIEATRAFQDWIRSSDESGVTRQDQLKEPQRRAGVSAGDVSIASGITCQDISEAIQVLRRVAWVLAISEGSAMKPWGESG